MGAHKCQVERSNEITLHPNQTTKHTNTDEEMIIESIVQKLEKLTNVLFKVTLVFGIPYVLYLIFAMIFHING
ncbi:hypothetical protein LGQ02_14490 [Bacillus shivajii]|uniref:hypothetical protein n=1 Tax=Bacillus shivajii TaxID=1983719 RepID=UPI001CFB509D|nr:hypothetical protein [Bacillus shivajii]UCZ52050.1 hypothetical protein LGQ02_14490 [Bacillus shivajii]